MSKTVKLALSVSLISFAVAAFVVMWLVTARSSSTDVDPTHPSGTPTFNKDIAPIVFEHCVMCHRPGESAPFALLSYEDVKDHAQQIADVTASGFMPPWLPEAGYGEFVGKRRLTERQIETLRQWAKRGAVQGDSADLPEPPAVTQGWQLGQPDLVITLPEPYTLPAGGTDVFRNLVVPIPVSTTRYVRAVELRPGNKTIVHHAIMMVDPMRTTRRLDEEDSAPGFEGMDTGFAEMPDGHILGWTPGKMPDAGRGSIPWSLEPGTDLVIQLHMFPSGKPELIQPQVGFFFDEAPRTAARTSSLILTAEFSAIDIPPGVKDYEVTDTFVLPVDAQVELVYPHAHYLGKDLQGFATLPDGTTRWLVRIKDWDFNWQDSYRYVEPLFLPKDTVLTMRWTFDNSTENVRNPNNPPQRVVGGVRTTDEMADLYLQLQLGSQREFDELEVAKLRHRLQTNSQDFRALTNLGETLGSQGRLDETIEYVRRALDIKPDYAPAHYILALALHSQGKLGEATDHYRQAVRFTPGHPVMHTQLAKALRDKGLFEEAIAECRIALEVNPEYAEAQLTLGKLLVKQGKPAQAIKPLRHALRIKPEDPDAHNNLGLAMTLQGEVQEAIGHYRQALQIKPDFVKAHNNLALALASQGQLAEAISHYREALRIEPERPEVHINLGLALALQGKLEEAMGHYREALRIHPDFVKAHHSLGMALESQGELDEAISHYRQALRIDPNRPDVHDKLGQVLASQGKLEEAIEHLRRTVELKPDNTKAQFRLAVMFGSLGMFDQAIEQYRAALELKPNHPIVLNNLAWLLAACPDVSLRRPEEAVELAKRALFSLNRRDAAVLDTLAGAYAAASEYELAVKTAQEALNLATDTADQKLADEIRSRLKRYQQGKPPRWEPAPEKNAAGP